MLDKIRVGINQAYQKIADRDNSVTAEKVRNAYLGLGMNHETLLAVFRQHNEDYEKQVGKLKSDTLQDYEVCKYVRLENGNGADVYNLEVIIALAFRIRLQGATRLREYVLGTVSKPNMQTATTLPTDTTATTEQPAQGISNGVGIKQKIATLEEYRQTFLRVPRIENRKPVFVSCEVRDRLDEIIRRLGGRRMSVLGLIENLARHHLETYGDDIERWRKLQSGYPFFIG